MATTVQGWGFRGLIKPQRGIDAQQQKRRKRSNHCGMKGSYVLPVFPTTSNARAFLRQYEDPTAVSQDLTKHTTPMPRTQPFGLVQPPIGALTSPSQEGSEFRMPAVVRQSRVQATCAAASNFVTKPKLLIMYLCRLLRPKASTKPKTLDS